MNGKNPVKRTVRFFRVSLLSVMLVWAGCQTISLFSQHAYLQDTSLKVDALILMDMGVDSFSVHKEKVNDLVVNIEKAYEYEKGRPDNSISAKMWAKLKDPDGNLLGGFIRLWEEKSILSKTYVQEKKKQVAAAFDQIIELESKKIKE